MGFKKSEEGKMKKREQSEYASVAARYGRDKGRAMYYTYHKEFIDYYCKSNFRKLAENGLMGLSNIRGNVVKTVRLDNLWVKLGSSSHELHRV